mgnify:CR=1 FL=1
MSTIFVDTSALIAIFDHRDKNHIRAKKSLEIVKRKRIKLLISDYIFDESITTVLSHARHDIAVEIGEFILSSNVMELVWLNEATKKKAWEYFKRHSDKGYSFTDCTSFVLMNEKKINQYFAFDDHFNKVGFIKFPHIFG